MIWPGVARAAGLAGLAGVGRWRLSPGSVQVQEVFAA